LVRVFFWLMQNNRRSLPFSFCFIFIWTNVKRLSLYWRLFSIEELKRIIEYLRRTFICCLTGAIHCPQVQYWIVLLRLPVNFYFSLVFFSLSHSLYCALFSFFYLLFVSHTNVDFSCRCSATHKEWLTHICVLLSVQIFYDSILEKRRLLVRMYASLSSNLFFNNFNRIKNLIEYDSILDNRNTSTFIWYHYNILISQWCLRVM
jgi:hypothetical protein